MRCRDHGSREDRQKTRLMWLVEEWGTDKFREMVGQQMGGVTLRKGIKEHVRPNPISLHVLCVLWCADMRLHCAGVGRKPALVHGTGGRQLVTLLLGRC